MRRLKEAPSLDWKCKAPVFRNNWLAKNIRNTVPPKELLVNIKTM